LYRIPPPLDVIAIALDAFGKETAALGHEGLPRERSLEIAAQTLAIGFAHDELNRPVKAPSPCLAELSLSDKPAD
jgi:hypothetical protein